MDPWRGGPSFLGVEDHHNHNVDIRMGVLVASLGSQGEDLPLHCHPVSCPHRGRVADDCRWHYPLWEYSRLLDCRTHHFNGGWYENLKKGTKNEIRLKFASNEHSGNFDSGFNLTGFTFPILFMCVPRNKRSGVSRWDEQSKIMVPRQTVKK